MRRSSSFVVLLILLAFAAMSCGEGGTSASEAEAPSATATEGGSVDPQTFAAQVASTDLWAGDPQEVQVGVFSSTNDGVSLLTGGTIDVRFSPYQGASGTPVEGTARYVPAPGTRGDADTSPTLTTPDIGRGVYQADATFDAAGVWQADVSFSLGGSPVQLSTQFQVGGQPSLPAPGQRALKTENLTMDAKGDPQAIDSRALDGAPVPDPELHRHTIAEAISDRVPSLVLFATPVYCQSQFCGPATDALQAIADARPDDAYYIHVEIWKDYAAGEINQAARDWLFRDDNLTEPWLFLIGSDGKILGRWGPLFDPEDVRVALDTAVG
jgi:hypothetical protein